MVLEAFGGEYVTSASAGGQGWLADHATTVNGKTVLSVGGKQRVLPRADAAGLARGVLSS